MFTGHCVKFKKKRNSAFYSRKYMAGKPRGAGRFASKYLLVSVWVDSAPPPPRSFLSGSNLVLLKRTVVG